VHAFLLGLLQQKLLFCKWKLHTKYK